MTELSDELLVAYVDGQLAREQTRAVDKVLEQDEVIARRVDALKEAHGRLESAFEAILAGEVSETSSRRCGPSRHCARASRHRATPPRWWVDRRCRARARHSRPSAGHAWPLTLARACSAVARYARASQADGADRRRPGKRTPRARTRLLSRASVEVGLESQGNRDLVAFQLAQAIGPAVKLPNLEAQGLNFVRAQLLRFGDKPLAQMLYLAGSARSARALRDGRGARQPARLQTRGRYRLGVSGGTTASPICWPDEEDEASLFRLAEKIRNEPVAPQPEPPPPPYQPQRSPRLCRRRAGARRRCRSRRRLPPEAAAPACTGAIGTQLRATARCGAPSANSRRRDSG